MVFIRFAGAFAALLLASGIASAQSPRPTDPQIAHIAYTAGQLDIAAAELALQKSKNKDVVAFATDMERDHKAVNEQALALVKKLNVTPEDNDTSKALTKQAAEKRAELAKLSGAAFDKAYIDNEVAYHKTVNGALQNTLIPSATNPELKPTRLSEGRSRCPCRLDDADCRWASNKTEPRSRLAFQCGMARSYSVVGK